MTVRGDVTLSEVAAVLTARSIGAVVVLGDGGSMEGVVSERDVMRKLAEHGPAALAMTADGQ